MRHPPKKMVQAQLNFSPEATQDLVVTPVLRQTHMPRFIMPAPRVMTDHLHLGYLQTSSVTDACPAAMGIRTLLCSNPPRKAAIGFSKVLHIVLTVGMTEILELWLARSLVGIRSQAGGKLTLNQHFKFVVSKFSVMLIVVRSV